MKIDSYYWGRRCLTFLTFLINVLYVKNAFAASHHPEDFLKKISGSTNEGAQIVQHYCANCHAKKPIIPLGAPRIGLASDWTPRIKQNLDALFKHTDEGFNAMPARGGCFECSDKQLYLAILAMLPETLKKSLLVKHQDYEENK